MRNSSLTNAENVARRIAINQIKAKGTNRNIVDNYVRKAPKAPEKKYHSTWITRFYEK